MKTTIALLTLGFAQLNGQDTELFTVSTPVPPPRLSCNATVSANKTTFTMKCTVNGKQMLNATIDLSVIDEKNGYVLSSSTGTPADSITVLITKNPTLRVSVALNGINVQEKDII